MCFFRGWVISGGHYNYAYHHIEQFASDIEDNGNADRIKFRRILELVAEAARAVEWVDSGDFGPEEEKEALDRLFEVLK